MFCDGEAYVVDDFKKLIKGSDGTVLWNSAEPDKGHFEELSRFGDAIATGGPSPIPFEEIVETTAVALHIEDLLHQGPDAPLMDQYLYVAPNLGEIATIENSELAATEDRHKVSIPVVGNDCLSRPDRRIVAPPESQGRGDRARARLAGSVAHPLCQPPFASAACARGSTGRPRKPSKRSMMSGSAASGGIGR